MQTLIYFVVVGMLSTRFCTPQSLTFNLSWKQDGDTEPQEPLKLPQGSSEAL